MQAAKSTAARLSVTLTLRQDRYVEEDEQIGRSIALVFAVITPDLASLGLRTSPVSWVGLSSKQTTGRFGSGSSA
jgi:hypothetical protein